MRYREHAPHPALARHVACHWTLQVDAVEGGALPAQRVLPDGCMDLLVRVGAGGAEAIVVGPMTRHGLSAPWQGRGIAATRFRPGEAFAFLDLPAQAARDLVVAPLDAGLGRRGDLERLLGALVAAQVAAWPRLLDRFLLDRLDGVRAAHRGVRRAVAALLGTAGGARVGPLARELGLSERHLERAFGERVGLSPKLLGRVARLQALVARVDALPSRQGGRSPAGPGMALAHLAADLGFADQAHLTREVVALCGIPPGALLRERRSDLFNPAPAGRGIARGS